MVITKCLDVYSSEFYIGMFGFNPDMDEEERLSWRDMQ